MHPENYCFSNDFPPQAKGPKACVFGAFGLGVFRTAPIPQNACYVDGFGKGPGSLETQFFRVFFDTLYWMPIRHKKARPIGRAFYF